MKLNYLEACGNTDIDDISFLKDMYDAGSFHSEDWREIWIDSLGLDINEDSPAMDVIGFLIAANVEVYYEPR